MHKHSYAQARRSAQRNGGGGGGGQGTDAEEQSAAADVSDQRVGLRQRVQAGDQPLAHLDGAGGGGGKFGRPSSVSR